MKTTVIFHSADWDGRFCEAIARKFLPADTQFIGWDFSDPPPPIPSEGQIYVMDLPVDRVFGWSFAGKSEAEIGLMVPFGFFSRVVWLDHHKSSIESHPSTIPGYRIDGVAACRLCFQYFTHPASPFNAKS